MKFHMPGAELFVPDQTAATAALKRTTVMAVSAHQDDLEIFSCHGILQAFGQSNQWYTGVVVTNGSGSPRAGLYADYTDTEMREIRRLEQKKAAVVGDFGALALLDYPSSAVKNGGDHRPVEDLRALFELARPEVVYTHNLADKHDTHVGVALKVIAALRELPPEARPKALYGGEVWRDLDWLPDADKVVLDVSGHENLQAALLGVFDSQIAGGKRYDLATLGRRRAHATYYASHGTDTATGLNFAMNLTPLLTDLQLDPAELVDSYILSFSSEVRERLASLR
ncbi:MAG: PIG-L family deacetylase [Lentisphaeria bacterium]